MYCPSWNTMMKDHGHHEKSMRISILHAFRALSCYYIQSRLQDPGRTYLSVKASPWRPCNAMPLIRATSIAPPTLHSAHAPLSSEWWEWTLNPPSTQPQFKRPLHRDPKGHCTWRVGSSRAGGSPLVDRLRKIAGGFGCRCVHPCSFTCS